MEYKMIRQLAELMKETDLTILEISEGDSVVKMERGGRQTAAAAPVPAAAVSIPQEQPAAAPQGESDKDIHTITAPMIGVFYAAPSPEMKSYVSVGDTVHAGDVLCIIEAMKMMNEITSEVTGVVTEICVGNRQVVEYGQPLFRIRRQESAEG